MRIRNCENGDEGDEGKVDMGVWEAEAAVGAGMGIRMGVWESGGETWIKRE